ncbi:phosphatidate phosphatase [Citrus sinensis]|uniref:Phosphatidate phosphatase n=1 Tax=Citrus sinensis TaxID=2711 RepID=A0ACB8KVE4_CITSI|nr:phosphatidate phosphatase [Citrus sinensis]
MYTVGRIGSYISRGVYTVSAPFHPFGGAVDIIVVEQPDGSFKSSPWYVRFGKFQGVLKTKEKVVTINVNGVDANFNMYLDHKGEAYFLKEADVEEGESASYPSSSSDEADGQPNNSRRLMKSQNCNCDADKLDSAAHFDASNRKMLPRTASQRARILGLVFGRKSFKESRYQKGEGDIDMVRLSSLERAEFAADLLEMKWSTNLPSSMSRKENASQILPHDGLDNMVAKGIQVNNEEIHVDLSVDDYEQNRNDQSILEKECGSQSEQMASSSHFSSKNLENFVEESGIDVSCLGSVEQVVESSALDESILDENSSIVSELSRTIGEFGVDNAYLAEHEQQSFPDAKIQYELEAHQGKHFDDEQACDNNDVASSGCRISTEAGSDQSFVYCETSETSIVGFDGSNGKSPETVYLASGKYGEVHVHLETVHVTTELLSKDTDVVQAEEIELEKEPGEVLENHSDQVNQAPCVLEHIEKDLKEPPEAPKSSTQVLGEESVLCSIKEVNSQNSCLTPIEVHEEKGITDDLQYLESTDESQELYNDSVLKRAVGNSPSDSSEEEQFLFSDLDEFKLCKVQGVDSSSPDSVKKSDDPAFSAEGIKEVNGSVNTIDESSSLSEMSGLYNLLNDFENTTDKLGAISDPIIIHKSHGPAEEVGRLAESLPNMRSLSVKLDAHDPHHPLSHSLDSNCKSLNWMLFKENDSSCMKSDTDIELHLAEEQPNINDMQFSQGQKTVFSTPAAGNPAKITVSPGGSWRLWPFFRRSRSGKAMQPVISGTKSSDTEVASDSINDRDGNRSVCKTNVAKKKIKVLTPTSEQLASLNLKEGKNSVTFTFSTAMLGKQQVDAKIYLWKWNTRIVISDVDGTITKSDVLGQFMPLVGVDWSQTGVAHLFSAIKENGYQLLFLSARAIVQAYHTRRFLFTLKQDGKALPDGPVVISPDGLFPSLFREVIRRAPHEFKIACLEDIKALFPSDCNPFYAGFGNRDTDEISYLKVGIPRGKIFIINPKGEVVVNHRVDSKTYSSIHALVHGMFPHTTSTEQEDFNQWNYWKLPPPNIDV